MKKFYAVQVGTNYDCDNGSYNKKEAMKIANSYKKNSYYDGDEIRIAVCINDCDDVIEEIIVREGER
jgi:hypothetical protein